jgi:hypothetical protein
VQQESEPDDCQELADVAEAVEVIRSHSLSGTDSSITHHSLDRTDRRLSEARRAHGETVADAETSRRFLVLVPSHLLLCHDVPSAVSPRRPCDQADLEEKCCSTEVEAGVLRRPGI